MDKLKAKRSFTLTDFRRYLGEKYPTSIAWINKPRNSRILSIAAFSFIFAYLLSFLFEGQVLYSIIDKYGVVSHKYIYYPMIAHFIGLFSIGFLMRTRWAPNSILMLVVSICLIATIPFFFPQSFFWPLGSIIAGYASGCTVAIWGYFLKTFTAKNERIKSSANVLIFSNILMIGINAVALNISPYIGLALSMLCLIIGLVIALILPVATTETQANIKSQKLPGYLKKPLAILFLFVAVITINSGLMYQVINPSFAHLSGTVKWHWAVPYIVAIAIMKNVRHRKKNALALHIGMSMIIAAFIFFLLLKRGVRDYLIINTLMMGGAGILDLFWWSSIGEMLEYTDNPTKLFGMGLSANVFGVLLGGALGIVLTSFKLSGAEVTIIALIVISASLVILPRLNQQLILLLKSQDIAANYKHVEKTQQNSITNHSEIIEPLTNREREVLKHILFGRSNKEIASLLFISVSTVKTHAHNIYSKYDVSSRVELMGSFLENQEELK